MELRVEKKCIQCAAIAKYMFFDWRFTKEGEPRYYCGNCKPYEELTLSSPLANEWTITQDELNDE